MKLLEAVYQLALAVAATLRWARRRVRHSKNKEAVEHALETSGDTSKIEERLSKPGP